MPKKLLAPTFYFYDFLKRKTTQVYFLVRIIMWNANSFKVEILRMSVKVKKKKKRW